jgi:8-oxo-dGTP diphosphatase
MQKYVVGFIFNKDLDSVLLMHKNRPAWQDGLINGLGGKVEEGEDTFTTISREIEEESGLIIEESEWIKSGKVYSGTFTMDVFGCVYDGDKEDATTKEDEEIEWFTISSLPPNTVENIPWLVHITLDKIKNNNFEQFEVQYNK